MQNVLQGLAKTVSEREKLVPENLFGGTFLSLQRNRTYS